MNNLQKNTWHLKIPLLIFLFLNLASQGQSPVSYTVDQSTTGHNLKKAFGLPNGKSGVLSLTETNHVFCSIVNSNGSIANSFDITAQLSPQNSLTVLEFNAIGTPVGNIFITYTSPSTDNITNQNARYLVLNQSGTTLASGNVNTSNQGPPTGLNRYLDLAVLSNGNVVVTWEIYQQNASDLNSSPASGSGIFRIFTEAGLAVTSDIVFAGPASTISTSILNSFGAKVAANSSGGFLIFFYNYLGNIRAIRFDNNGVVQPTGGVNSFIIDPTAWTGNFRLYKAVGLANGSYMLCWSIAGVGYYKIINASGAELKAKTSLTDPDLAREVSTNGWIGVAAVNTSGKQGFTLAIIHWQVYSDLSNPYIKARTYNYDLSGTFQSLSDLTADFIADPQPVLSLYSGQPSGIGVAFRTYKTFTPIPNNFTVPSDADLRGSTVDFNLPKVTSISRLTPSGQLTNASTVTYQVVFSTAVTGVDASDFSLSTTGSVTGTIGTVSGSGSSYTVQVGSIAGNGTLRLDLKNSGTGIVSDGSTAIITGFSTGETYTLDHIAPTLSSVTITSSNANPTYAKIGDKVTVSFTASEPIQTPTITIAGQTATVSHLSGDQWKAEFSMTSSQAEGTVPFNISFSDLAGNAGSPVNAVTSGGGNVIFDKTTPLITSLVRFDPSVQTTSATLVTFRITFSEAISGLDNTDFTLSGPVTGSIETVTTVNGSENTQFDVSVNNLSGDGSLGINLKSVGTGIIDVAGNGSAGFTAGETYNRVTGPTVMSITRLTPLNQLTNATTLTYQVEFSSTVTGVDALDFGLFSAEGITGTINTVSGSGNTYTITVTDIVGNGSLRLDVNSSGTGIQDENNTNILGGYFAGETYTIDYVPPTLTSIIIQSNNTDPNYAKVGDKVTVLFTSSESIQTPTVSILGQTATVSNVSANQWKGEYTMQGTDAPEGSITFSVNFTDMAGNNGTAVTTAIGGSGVTFDKTIPTLTSVHIQSNNTSTNNAKIGDLVTLTFTSNEPVTNISVSIAGHLVTIISAGENRYSAAYTMSGADLEGTVTFSISGIKDAAGNISSIFSATTDESNVIFDKSVPTLTSVVIASNDQNPAYAKLGNTVTLTFTANEAIQISSVILAGHSLTVTNTGGNTWTANYVMAAIDAEGLISFQINFNDVAGNNGLEISATTNNSSIIFDKTVPALSSVSIGSNNANSSYAKVGDIVTVSFASDEAIQTTATIANHSSIITHTSNNLYTATFTMTSTDAEGDIPFNISFTDLAGNQGVNVMAVTNGSSVRFDRTAPVVTSINRFNFNQQGTTSTTLKFTTTFQENITGLDASDFVLTNVSGNAGTSSITDVSAVSSSVYQITVTVSTINGAEVRLDLKATGTDIKDVAGNIFTTGFTSGQTYILGQPPTITQIQTNILASPNQTGCTSLQSFEVKASGSPTPTIRYKIGNIFITSPYAFPTGVTTVNVTASNGIGAIAGTSFTVTVSSNLNVSIPSASAYSKGVSQNTIYIGWAPASTINYTSSAGGGQSSYTYKWTTNSNNLYIVGSSTSSSVQVTSTKAGSYILTLEVTDGYGCKQSSTQTITVIDIRCGNKKDKVTICKTTKPAGTICIEPGSVVNQLNAGAFLGNCPSSMFTTTRMQNEQNTSIEQKLWLQALPNPTTNQFTLYFNVSNQESISFRIVDVLGRTVESRKGIAANSTFQFGVNYRPGIYILEAVKGNERVTIKLIKQTN